MPRFSTSSPFSTFNFVPPSNVEPADIPVGALVFYNAAFSTGSVPGWTRYTTADGFFIKGTATQGQITTTTAPSLSGTCAVTLGSAGSHQPTQISFGPAFNPAGVAFPGGYFNLGVSGSHTHSVTNIDMSTVNVPQPATFKQNIILQCTTTTKRLPPNCVVFSQNQPTSAFSLITADNRPIRGGTTNIVGAGTYTSRTGQTSQSGTHSHIDTNSPYDPATVVGLNNNYQTGFTHQHTWAVLFYASSILTKLLAAWGANAETYLGQNSIMMYSGTLTSLPFGWYVCDGTNGTINMVDFFVGYGTQGAWNTTTGSNNNITTGQSTSTNTWTHNHQGPNFGSSRPATLASIPHGTFSASHSHSVSTSLTSVSYDPGTIKLAFIQYTGV